MSSRRRPGRTPARPWQPMRRAQRILPDELLLAADKDPAVAGALARSLEEEVWRNDRYIVHVRRREDGSVERLSIRRAGNKAGNDWRHMQQIKNEIAGEHAEGAMLYPDTGRLVDTANQYWIYVLPPGQRFPFGFNERSVLGPGEDPRFPASKQRPFQEIADNEPDTSPADVG